MDVKNFLKDEFGGVLTTEMIILMGVIAASLAGAVLVLFNAMSGYFTTWAGFFSSGAGG